MRLFRNSNATHFTLTKVITMSQLFTPAPEPPTELGRYRILSSTAGIRVSPLILGGMSIGTAWSDVLGKVTKESAFEVLDAYLAAGGNFIDTANSYQDEESEQWIGQWMEERGVRDRVIISTKYSSDYRSHALGKGNTPNASGNHKRSLHLSVRDSLMKLKTEWIDILYVHFWDWTVSIEEVMDSLHIMVQQGKVLYLGVSDCPAWVVGVANTYARDHGKTQFSIYQGRWNVLQRDVEREIVPMLRHFGMAMAPWDVLGGGRFQTKVSLKERKSKGENIRTLLGGKEQTEDEEKVSEALAVVAAEHGVKSITTIALAYVLAKAPNVFPLVGGRKVDHLQANIEALKLRLTDRQIQYLEDVKPLELGFPIDQIGEDPRISGQAQPLVAAAGAHAFVKYPKPIGYQ